MNTPAVDEYRLERFLYHLTRYLPPTPVAVAYAAKLAAERWEVYDLEDQTAIYWLAVGVERRRHARRSPRQLVLPTMGAEARP